MTESSLIHEVQFPNSNSTINQRKNAKKDNFKFLHYKQTGLVHFVQLGSSLYPFFDHYKLLWKKLSYDFYQAHENRLEHDLEHNMRDKTADRLKSGPHGLSV